MRTVGIVAEYNPFHAGHARHIAETRRALGEDCAVAAAMSGNFVQRGDCALFDKWRRARAALEGGADLVLELPTVWAAASAERFARGAVNILRAAGAECLSFGSESGDADGLKTLAASLDGPAYDAALREELAGGASFAACRQKAAAGLAGAERAALLANPNDNLAVEYLRAARRLGWVPEVVAVPRAGAGHDGGDHPDYPSASYLREQIRAGKLQSEGFADLRRAERAVLARLRSMSLSGFEALPDSGEGLASRLYRAVQRGTSLEEVWALAKTKRYAHARLRRMTLWAFLGLTAADVPENPPYLRVLGCNARGREILKRLKKTAPLPVLTKPAHAKELDGEGRRLFELEARCTDLYDLCLDPVPVPGREWTTSPVIL